MKTIAIIILLTISFTAFSGNGAKLQWIDEKGVNHINSTCSIGYVETSDLNGGTYIALNCKEGIKTPINNNNALSTIIMINGSPRLICPAEEVNIYSFSDFEINIDCRF